MHIHVCHRHASLCRMGPLFTSTANSSYRLAPRNETLIDFDNSTAELLFNRNISTPPPSLCIRYIPTASRLRSSYILPRYLNHDATPPSRRRLERSIPLPDIPQVKLATITQYGPQPRSYNLGTPYGTYSRRNRRDIRPVPPDTLPCTQHVTPAEHPLDTPPVLRRSTRIRHTPDRLGTSN